MKLVSRHQYHYWKFGRSGLICWSENKKKKNIKKWKHKQTDQKVVESDVFPTPVIIYELLQSIVYC